MHRLYATIVGHQAKVCTYKQIVEHLGNR